MRRPRIRLTVRRLMVGVAILAGLAGLAREFADGVPPRSVVRGIPARVERLRPGMTRAEVREALGLGRSWLRGGTGARFAFYYTHGNRIVEQYFVPRSLRASLLGRQPDLSREMFSGPTLHLVYEFDFREGPDAALRGDSNRLVSAGYREPVGPSVAMPGSR